MHILAPEKAKALLAEIHRKIIDGDIQNLGYDISETSDDSIQGLKRYDGLPQHVYKQEAIERGKAVYQEHVDGWPRIVEKPIPENAVPFEARVHSGVVIETHFADRAMTRDVVKLIDQAMLSAGFKQEIIPEAKWHSYGVNKARGSETTRLTDDHYSLSYGSDSVVLLRFATDEGVKRFQERYSTIASAIAAAPEAVLTPPR